MNLLVALRESSSFSRFFHGVVRDLCDMWCLCQELCKRHRATQITFSIDHHDLPRLRQVPVHSVLGFLGNQIATFDDEDGHVFLDAPDLVLLGIASQLANAVLNPKPQTLSPKP